MPIWQEVVTGEERAWQEAERVYPPPGLGGKIDLAAERARTKERYQMVLALGKKYEKEEWSSIANITGILREAGEARRAGRAGLAPGRPTSTRIT